MRGCQFDTWLVGEVIDTTEPWRYLAIPEPVSSVFGVS
jgi:hypothetical protein